MSTVNRIVEHSFRTGARLGRPQIEARMRHSINLIRPSELVWDEGSDTVSENSGLVYNGKARIYAVSGSAVITFGDSPQFFASTFILVPMSAPLPMINDIATITAGPDPALLNRSYRLTDVEEPGELMLFRRCQATGVEPSTLVGIRSWT